MTDTESISKVTDIINDSRIGMLTTINEEGALVSRPLAVQDVKDVTLPTETVACG